MGFFGALMGNASEVDADEIRTRLDGILVPDEEIRLAYKLVRDYFVFTEARLILVNIQGITGKKTQYHSIPYKSITHFSLETAGTFDLDAELKLWISGTEAPVERTLSKGANIPAIQQALAAGVLEGF